MDDWRMQNMEAGVGIIRRIDELGRIVISKEIRRQLRVNEGDAFEEKIITENGIPVGVSIKKYDEVRPFRDAVESIMIELKNQRYDLNLPSDTFAKIMNSLNDVCKELYSHEK